MDSEYTSRYIIIQRKRKKLQRIAETHSSYDALQYPLIYLRGLDGHHFNLKQVIPNAGTETNRKVTPR